MKVDKFLVAVSISIFLLAGLLFLLVYLLLRFYRAKLFGYIYMIYCNILISGVV